MKQLFCCKKCGFISTIRNEYTIKDGLLVCLDCSKNAEKPTAAA